MNKSNILIYNDKNYIIKDIYTPKTISELDDLSYHKLSITIYGTVKDFTKGPDIIENVFIINNDKLIKYEHIINDYYIKDNNIETYYLKAYEETIDIQYNDENKYALEYYKWYLRKRKLYRLINEIN